jgi:hypothetical protein
MSKELVIENGLQIWENGHNARTSPRVCSIVNASEPVEQLTRQQQEAYAHLFKASPLLLEACEYAIQWIDNIAKNNPDALLDAMPNNTLGRTFIRHAIAKAKGL